MKVDAVLDGRRVFGLVRGDLPEHFTRCPRCGFLLDMRRLDGLIRHEQRCEADVANDC